MRAKWWTGSSLLLVPIATVAILTATLAAEFQKPVTQWTCAEFLSVDDEFKPTVVHWATTYAKGQPEATAVDIEGIEKVTPQIIGECTKAPQDSFWSRLQDEWKKAGAEKEG
jgi:acid stress chaperone HdeA